MLIQNLVPDVCVELLLGREVGVKLLDDQLDEQLHLLLIFSDAVDLLDKTNLHLILHLINPYPALSVMLTLRADLLMQYSKFELNLEIEKKP